MIYILYQLDLLKDLLQLPLVVEHLDLLCFIEALGEVLAAIRIVHLTHNVIVHLIDLTFVLYGDLVRAAHGLLIRHYVTYFS